MEGGEGVNLDEKPKAVRAFTTRLDIASRCETCEHMRTSGQLDSEGYDSSGSCRLLDIKVVDIRKSCCPAYESVNQIGYMENPMSEATEGNPKDGLHQPDQAVERDCTEQIIALAIEIRLIQMKRSRYEVEDFESNLKDARDIIERSNKYRDQIAEKWRNRG